MEHRSTRNGRTGHPPPKMALAPMYERVGRLGRRYLVGRVGLLKLLIVPTGAISKGNAVWQAYVMQGPYATEEQAALADAVDADVHP